MAWAERLTLGGGTKRVLGLDMARRERSAGDTALSGVGLAVGVWCVWGDMDEEPSSDSVESSTELIEPALVSSLAVAGLLALLWAGVGRRRGMH